MGVLNVTPDSFSDGGLYVDADSAERQALKMEAEGADLIDVGAESSRPGAQAVPVLEEIRRLRPILKRLARKVRVPLSVDTHRSETARMALDEGAVLINDIYALRKDPKIARLAARYKAGLVLMHMRGTPRTMQSAPRYRDIWTDVLGFLSSALERALDAGVPRASVLLDPGFGFGKTTAHNLALLGGLDRLEVLGQPVLAGLSRKSFVGNLIGAPVEERLVGSVAAGAAAIARGAHMLRVHDVLAHRQAAAIVDAVFGGHAITVGADTSRGRRAA
jgi:dihydropteroate synthase